MSSSTLLQSWISSDLSFFTMLDYLDEGILIVDKDNNILASNTKISRILNTPFRRIAGMPLGEIMKELLNLRPFEEMVIKLELQGMPKETYVSCKCFTFPLGEREIIKLYILKDLIPLEERTKKGEQRLPERPLEIITNNEEMRDIIDFCIHVAKSDAPVLIQGETGTGKELIANLIHNYSLRKDKPFIKINCAAIPESLLESELFGYVKGAFTGAYVDRAGRFELANGGTIFLDEIAEMSPALQAKLLRVLESKTFERLGSNKSIKVDVRVISATNKNLKVEIQKGTFREDLYYRISVIPIFLPPLRQRKEDIPLLINHFLREFEIKGYQKINQVDPEAMKALISYHWPGNIKELKNVIEYALVCAKNNVLTLDCLPDHIKTQKEESSNSSATTKIEKNDIIIPNNKERLKFSKRKKYVRRNLEECLKVLRECGNNLSLAAKILNIDRTTLYKKIKALRLKNSEFS